MWTVSRWPVSFFLALPFPASAAVWIGAGGEVGASDGMVSVVCPARDFVIPGCLSGARKVPDYGSLAEAVWYVLLGVSRCPRNDPSGAWRVGGVRLGGPASSLELSVVGEGAWRAGLVASMGGGVVTVYVSLSKGDAPLSPELTVGANEDAVDWTIFPPLEYSSGEGQTFGSPLVARYLQRRRGIKIPPAATLSPCSERLCALPQNDPSREASTR